MAKSTKKSKVVPDIIKVNDFEIEVGAIYKVINRPDKSAPEAFQEKGSTKLPSVEVANYRGVNFVSDELGNGVYDTGLYEDSPCYALLDRDEVKLRVNALKKYVVEPYERFMGKEGLLNHNNLEFWDNFSYKLGVDRAFKTSQASDLLDLVQAVLSYQLVPKNEKGNPRYGAAQYMVEDVTKYKGHKEEINNNFMEAVLSFGKLLENNRVTAIRALEYIGFNTISEDIENSSLNSMVYSWLMNDDGNAVKLLRIYEKALTSDGSDEIALFHILNKKVRTGQVSNISGEYYYGEIPLGVDLKEAASRLMKDKELLEVRHALMTV